MLLLEPICCSKSVEFLVTCRTSLQFSEFQSVGFRQTISEFLEEHSWLRIISELTTPLVDSTTASDQLMRRVRQFVHPRVPTVMLELIMIPVPHVTDMWLIIVRRRQTGGADCWIPDFSRSKHIYPLRNILYFDVRHYNRILAAMMATCPQLVYNRFSFRFNCEDITENRSNTCRNRWNVWSINWWECSTCTKSHDRGFILVEEPSLDWVQ